MIRDKLFQSWDENAEEWISVIEQGLISSRRFTNAALLALVDKAKPKRVLDVGCGEGWLCNELNRRGIGTIGIDSCSSLIERARAKGSGEFYVMDYFEMAQRKEIIERDIDCVVFNFSIFEEENLSSLLRDVSSLLTPEGTIIIQTISTKSESGWKPDAWAGLPGNFTNGHPYFLRSVNQWYEVASESGLSIEELTPVKNDQGEIVSHIFLIRKP